MLAGGVRAGGMHAHGARAFSRGSKGPTLMTDMNPPSLASARGPRIRVYSPHLSSIWALGRAILAQRAEFRSPGLQSQAQHRKFGKAEANEAGPIVGEPGAAEPNSAEPKIYIDV